MLGFLSGCGAVHFLPGLPGQRAWVGLALGGTLLGAFLWRVSRRCDWRVPARSLLWPLWASVAGAVFAGLSAEQRLADRLTEDNHGKVARVELMVSGLPRLAPDSRVFEAEVLASRPAGLPSRIQVSWSAPGHSGPYGRPGKPAHAFPEIAPGQVWRMALSMRRPHGAHNPQGFDYESHVFAQGIRAMGSVRGDPVLLAELGGSGVELMAQQARHAIRKAVAPHIEGMRYGAVLLALSIGDQAAVPSSDWVVFNRASISHLIAISGGHITMIAALGGFSTFWLWRRVKLRGRMLAERMPAQVAAGLAALSVAWAYCLLAGWGVPARRTFLMLCVIAGAHVLRVPMNASRLLLLAAVAVVVLDPWALLASGFWLSFGAVGVLMASSAWVGQSLCSPSASRWGRVRSGLWAAVRLQCAVSLALMPLLAWMFNEVSLVSPLANAYAIPLITFVVTPLSLILAGVALIPGLDVIAAWTAWLAHGTLDGLMQPTNWLVRAELASVAAAAAPAWALLLALAGVGLAMLPRGLPLRQSAWLLMLPVLWWRPERPGQGEWHLHALDVGQGSAIIVQTAQRSLLFDTGRRASPDSDSGGRIIVPALKALGERGLDVLVVSHADIDHAGGLRSVLEWGAVGQSYASFDLAAHVRREASLLHMPGQLPRLPAAESPCRYGQQWQVDGVSFEFLWPLDTASEGLFESGTKGRNARACVLRIRGRHHAALLTGDIGVEQERALVDRGLGPVDVVMAAHHGSRSSSHPLFVQAVDASHVVVQAGADNRYGHPAPAVVRRWEAAGAVLWRTDRHGAVSIYSSSQGLLTHASRFTRKRYWHGQ